jgi:hypothetical protein
MPQIITSIHRVEEPSQEPRGVQQLERNPFPNTEIYLIEKKEDVLIAFLRDHVRRIEEDVPVRYMGPDPLVPGKKPIFFSTTHENPYVLLETDADYCTIGLAFSESGEAVMFHKPFETTKSVSTEFDAFFKQFNDTVVEVCGSDAYLLLSGMNMPDRYRRGVYREAARRVTAVNPANKHTILATFNGEDNERDNTYRADFKLSGVVFIPKDHSISGENVIVLLSNMLLDEETIDFIN